MDPSTRFKLMLAAPFAAALLGAYLMATHGPKPGVGVVPIHGGEFEMGRDGLDDAPLRRVRVRSFVIDATEVTVRAYQACVDKGACTSAVREHPRCNAGHDERDSHPINCVTHAQAAAYCAYDGKRLPSEEEWEYAARSDGRSYPWGEAQPSDQLCWRSSKTCPVGSYTEGQARGGIQDMAGNVWEWTASRFGKATGVFTVKGGPLAFGDDEIRALSAYRVGMPETSIEWDLGVRCVRDLPAVSPPSARPSAVPTGSIR